MKRKTSIKIWKTKKADAEFSKWIRSRDGKCARCGKTEYLQCSHFWPRANSSVRYYPENCDALCYGCHYGNRSYGWEYAKQGDYREFKLKQLGEKGYALLEKRSRTIMLREKAIIECMSLLSVENSLDIKS